MNLVALIKKIRNIPQEIKYTLFLFVITRSVLTIIGVSTRSLLAKVDGYKYLYKHSKHLWLDIWNVWDSGWYLNIAQNWYPIHFKVGQSNYGFFPLYPFSIRILGKVIGSNYISGLIISNICLFFSCIFLYKLVKLQSDNDTALRSIKYLFLFPSAFILSGVFSESLFLILLIICFYYSKKNNWLLVGIAGFFLALTRPLGICVVIPLLYEYLKSKHFRLKNIRSDILFVLLISLGPIVFSAHCHYLSGNFLAYIMAQKIGWYAIAFNPAKLLYQCLFTDHIKHLSRISMVFNATFIIAVMGILTSFYRKIGFSYWVLGMLFALMPLSSGSSSVLGLTRYSLVIFPLYIIFAKLGKNRYVDQGLVLFLALLQGFLMVFWCAGFYFII